MLSFFHFVTRSRLLRAAAPGALLSLALCSAAVDAQVAAAPSPQKYPWDKRPGKCFGAPPGTPLPSFCAEPDHWSDSAVAWAHAYELMLNEDFDLLERAGKEVGLQPGKFTSGDYLFETWTAALKSVFEIDERAYERAVRWQQAKGEQGFSRLAMAVAKRGQAFRARDAGHANGLPAEGWDLFYRKLEEANDLLDGAPPPLKQSGPWQVLKVEVVFESLKHKEERAAVLEAATRAWPDSAMIYGVPMRFARERGGSYATMDTVARFALQRTRERLGAAMYATLYEQAFRAPTRLNLRNSAVDWSLMKQGFRDAESKRIGLPATWKNYAAFACQMRDKDEARRLYAVYDSLRAAPEADEADPCRLFATSS